MCAPIAGPAASPVVSPVPACIGREVNGLSLYFHYYSSGHIKAECLNEVFLRFYVRSWLLFYIIYKQIKSLERLFFIELETHMVRRT